REFDTMNLSFLDAVSCGFGAIILLLVITKLFEPIRLEETQTDLDRLMVRYQQELEDILGETEIVRREQASLVDEVELEEVQIAHLQRQVRRSRAEMLDRQDGAEVANELAGRLAQAKQELTEEMERLLADYRPPIEEYKIGGIPVDSEYIIFVIDTSGSMRQYAWDRVQRQIREIGRASCRERGEI